MQPFVQGERTVPSGCPPMLARARRLAGGPLNGAGAPDATVKKVGLYLVDI